METTLKLQTFIISTGNRAINIVYNIGGLGFWPFFLVVGGALYYINIIGTNVTDNLSDGPVEKTMIVDNNSEVTNIMAIKEINSGTSHVRIKIICNGAKSFVGIIPTRLGVGDYISSYQSAS